MTVSDCRRRTGNLESALVESSIGLYNTEVVDTPPRFCSEAADLGAETADWVRWYNSTRLHSAIGRRPPIEYETLYHQPATDIGVA